MTEYAIYNKDKTICGRMVITKQGFRWVEKKVNDVDATYRLIRAIFENGKK